MPSSMISSVLTEERVVAFTFDDGPNPLYTIQLLELFKKAGGKATFFMIGAHIDAYPEVAEQVHAAGHEIGNHTYTHPKLTGLPLEEAREQLLRTDERIRRITGQPVRLFRPPYFNVNDEVLSLADDLGYLSIGAVESEARDWDQPGVEHILKHTRSSISNGCILLFHDGYDNKSQTVEAVRILLEELAGEGYRFVTVSELLDSESF